MTPPEDLCLVLAGARERLGAFADLHYADTIGSTNDAVAQLAAAGAAEGVSVLAEQQTAGRGRQRRVWSSPPGAGLYLSVLLRGRVFMTAPGLVTLGAGVAAADAVMAATGVRAQLKWPNDLVIGGAWKKLGGILCEAQAPDAIVVGVGINLTPAAHPTDVAARAASIAGELGRPVARAALVVACLDRLRMLAGAVRSDPPGALLDRWRACAAAGWQGALVQWQDGDRTSRGVVCDIDHDGALLVDRDGHRERVMAGDVVWDRQS